MNSAVRILKCGRSEASEDLKSDRGEKSGQQTTRELVSTIKGWIAELEQRRREEERAGATFIK